MSLPEIIPPEQARAWRSEQGAEQASAFAAASGAERIDLDHIKSLFLRRLGLAVAIFLTIFTLTVVKTFTTPKQYTASAEVVLNTRGEIAPEVLEEGGDILRGEAELSTELRILYSRELALTIVDALDLVHDPEFSPLMMAGRAKPSLMARLFGADSAPPATPTEEALEASRPLVADYLRSGLRASRISNTYSLNITYIHSNPYRAAQMADAYASAYVQDQLTRKQQSSRGNADFLNVKIEELRQQAQSDQEKVQEFRIANNMLSTTGATLTEQDISALNQQLAQAKAVAAEDAARLATARQRLEVGSVGDDVGDVLASGVVQSLRAQRANISVRVADLRGRYGPDHPELKKGEVELRDIDEQIQTEINRVISGLEGKYNVSRQRVTSLTASLNQLKSELAKNNTASVELGDLERRARASQALYESFLNSYKETVAREGVEKADARIITAARVPGAPSKPNIPLSLIFGVMFGGTVAAVAAFLMEVTYGGFTSTAEVEQKLGVSAMGSVPINKTVSPHGKSVLATVTKHPHSPLSESLSSLMTSIQFRLRRPGPHVVYVTSAVPDEGKTTLTTALGMASARAGEKTIIIDCDRMKRDLSRLAGKPAEIGISDVLEDRATLDEAIITTSANRPDILKNTDAGRDDDNFTDDERFSWLIGELKQRYDMIILDGAPVMPFAEARKLAVHADFVLFAVHWRKTRVNTVRQAIRTLPQSAIGAVGVALTRVNAKLQSRFGVEDTLAYSNKYIKHYLA
ncbi:GumC family protein [Hyphococcus sp.]|uniref:GumC family protein n=1 Tax=Hyphococcus sp. TaxID=2038636 RepID=UPI0035C6DA01